MTTFHSSFSCTSAIKMFVDVFSHFYNNITLLKDYEQIQMIFEEEDSELLATHGNKKKKYETQELKKQPTTNSFENK